MEGNRRIGRFKLNASPEMLMWRIEDYVEKPFDRWVSNHVEQRCIVIVYLCSCCNCGMSIKVIVLVMHYCLIQETSKCTTRVLLHTSMRFNTRPSNL